MEHVLDQSPHHLNLKACKARDIVMIFDDYLEILINKVRKVTNEQGLLALDANVVKDMDFKEIMKAAFCTLRLSK